MFHGSLRLVRRRAPPPASGPPPDVQRWSEPMLLRGLASDGSLPFRSSLLRQSFSMCSSHKLRPVTHALEASIARGALDLAARPLLVLFDRRSEAEYTLSAVVRRNERDGGDSDCDCDCDVELNYDPGPTRAVPSELGSYSAIELDLPRAPPGNDGARGRITLHISGLHDERLVRLVSEGLAIEPS